MSDKFDDDEYDAPPISSWPQYGMSHPYFGEIAPNPAAEEGTKASVGEPLKDGEKIATIADVIEAMRTVFDPEIPVNIYDLGLIYEHEIKDNGDCEILMTLTAPACPVAGEMPGQVAAAVAKLDGIGVATVTLTWEPAWDMSKMSEDAKMALDVW